MAELAEAIVIAAITLAPFAIALAAAGLIVAAVGAARLASALGLDLGDER